MQQNKNPRLWAIIGVGLSLVTLPLFLIAGFAIGANCVLRVDKTLCNIQALTNDAALLFNVVCIFLFVFFLFKPNPKIAGRILVIYPIFLIIVFLIFFLTKNIS